MARVGTLRKWCEEQYALLRPTLERRKAEGFIRECHGDMHLRNLAWVDDGPLAFDCIEFNPELRWIDVMSEIAFLVMDLDDRGRPQLAQRFLNAYLGHSGDYAGLRLLRFYLVYRALVRAMVDAIRADQAGITQRERQQAGAEAEGYLQLALGYTRRPRPMLLIARGLSASGKTTLSQPLLQALPAVRIRSDVERKRLYGLSPEQDGHAAIGEGLYGPDATERTYDRLLELAADILQAGHSVIVDATNQSREQREPFYKLAGRMGVPYVVVEFTAAPDTLRRRIAARRHDASDADLQVLEHQLTKWRPLDGDEETHAVRIDTEQPFDVQALIREIERVTGTTAKGPA